MIAAMASAQPLGNGGVHGKTKWNAKGFRITGPSMKKLLIALLAATALAACTPTPEAPANAGAPPVNAAAPRTASGLPDADPAMWVVRDEDTTIYLFGTFHLLDGRTEWFNDEVKQAFDQSQELVFEVDMAGGEAAMAQAMQPLIMRYAIDQQGRKVSAELSAEQNRILNEALAGLGAPAGAFDSFEPWFVSLTLSAVVAQKLGLTGENGAENVLRRAAEARGNMSFGAVETLESQIQMFDSAPREAQIRGLKETLDNMDEMTAMLPRMLAVWNSGDAAGLEQVMNEGLNENPGLRRALLENRNRNWAEWIDQRLDRPGTVFMAVGAGHLSGVDSVQVFLRQRNIGSERVPALTPGR